MRPIALYTYSSLNMTYTGHVLPFPTILTLWNTWVHVGTMNCGDKASYIEASVNYFLGVGPILCVPNVDPNYGHIEFGQDLDDPRLGCKNDVIEYVIIL